MRGTDDNADPMPDTATVSWASLIRRSTSEDGDADELYRRMADSLAANKTQPKPARGMAQKAQELVRNHFNTSLSLYDMAKMLNTNHTKLQQEYKREFGTTIHRAMIGMRMAEARKRAECGAYSVKQIAGMVGYQKQSYFISVFCRFFGTTPGKIRKAVRSE